MAVCRVLLEEPGATISRHLFGHFAEHLGACIEEGLWVGEESPIPNTDGIRDDVLAALRRIAPPVIRWPGGCFADTYHWEDGVGPRAERPRRVNVWWGGVIEPNQFGTHEFLRTCRLLGAAPYLCGNLGSGSPGELAGWIEYCNYDRDSTRAAQRRANGAEAPFGVNFWGVGNENWGCGGAMEPDDYAREYRRFATYCHEFGGVPLFLIACGPNGNNVDWTRRFFERLAGRARLHGYAAHYYCGTVGTSTEYTADGCQQLVHRALTTMERLVRQQRATLDSYDPDRRVKLIVDEWGTWHPPDPHHPRHGLWQQNTVRDALVAAGTLNVFCRHADTVYMANIAQMINVLQAMILTDGPRMLCTPTYHVYEMFVPHHEATAVPVVFDAGRVAFTGGDGKPAEIDELAGAASLKGKRLHLTVTAHDLSAPTELRVSLRGGAAATVAARVLAGELITSHNTFDAPDAVCPRGLAARIDGGDVVVELPPASVTALAIEVA